MGSSSSKEHIDVIVEAPKSSGSFLLPVFATGIVLGFVAGYQTAEKTYATEKQIEEQWRKTKIMSGTAAVVALSLLVWAKA